MIIKDAIKFRERNGNFESPLEALSRSDGFEQENVGPPPLPGTLIQY